MRRLWLRSQAAALSEPTGCGAIRYCEAKPKSDPEDPLEVTQIFFAASSSLAVAFGSGLAMAFIRFGSERQSPPWLAKLHGFAATAALTLLGFAWLHVEFSRAESLALLLLLLAAAGGIVLNLGYHWRQKPLPEALLFVHMSVAFAGFLLMFLVTISRAS